MSTFEEDNLELEQEERDNLRQELEEKLEKEETARLTFITRLFLTIILLILISNITLIPTTEFWGILSSDQILGRTYMILALISFVFCVILLIIDFLIPFMKLIIRKKAPGENLGEDMFLFTKLSSPFRISKVRFSISVTLGVSAVLLLIGSQVLFWGFMVF